jgi:hypothetical protein
VKEKYAKATHSDIKDFHFSFNGYEPRRRELVGGIVGLTGDSVIGVVENLQKDKKYQPKKMYVSEDARGYGYESLKQVGVRCSFLSFLVFSILFQSPKPL